MLADHAAGYAFIVLLRDSDDATGLARLLEDVRLPSPPKPSVFAAPPVRGVDFFADESRQGEIDSWWGETIPGDHYPVYLLMHEEGLGEWITGIDGTFYVGLPNASVAGQYTESEQLQPFTAGGPLDFATMVMRDFSTAGGARDEDDILFDEGEALRMAALSSDFPLDLDDTGFDFEAPPNAAPGYANPFGPAPGQPVAPGANPFAPAPGSPYAPGPGGPFDTPLPVPGVPQAPRPKPAAAAAPATPHPFDLLSQTPPGAPVQPGPAAPYPAPAPFPAPAPGPGPVPGPGPAPMPFNGAPPPGQPMPNPLIPAGPAPGQWGQPAPYQQPPPKAGKGLRFSLPKWPSRGGARPGFTPTPDRELAALMVDRGPTVVVFGSRKGGVGKTSFAAGVSIVAGTVLDQVGHKAAIVDANIANPDAWGQMNLPPGAATVREVVAALTANREPPPPAHASTPALACYPESRETTEYSKTDVRRFAEYLRRRYTFIIVDLTNRLPDPMAGPESAAAAYWLEHADVLVIPTTSDKKDFNGVLDYLDVRDLPPTVVSYIIPPDRRNREHAVTQEYLSVIRSRVHRIVEAPEEPNKVRLAGMEGVPVEQISTGLRAAYRELTETIVRVPARARS